MMFTGCFRGETYGAFPGTAPLCPDLGKNLKRARVSLRANLVLETSGYA